MIRSPSLFFRFPIPPDRCGAGHAKPSTGSALVLVLVVIAMLSLGAYTFSELMVTEYHAADATRRQIQSRAWAVSGVEYAASLLSNDGQGWQTDLYHNPSLFHLPVSETGGFTIVAPLEDLSGPQTPGQNSSAFRLGLMDESAKLNLNVLATYDPADSKARNMLLFLPNMTEELADCILDWIDSDDEPRTSGKEYESYDQVLPRNGPLTSLDELLLVDGVTPALLYGEDTNQNGRLDAGENDGLDSLPDDNADDELNLGWNAYFTVHSKEGNLQHDPDYLRQPRINVNTQSVADLYDILEERLDSEAALFIAAYRVNGPVEALNIPTLQSTTTGQTASGSSGSTSGSGTGTGTGSSTGTGTGTSGGASSSTSGGSSSGGSSASSRSGSSSGTGMQGSSSGQSTGRSGSTSTGNSRTGNSSIDSGLSNVANALAGALGGGTGSVTRGGLDLTNGGSVQIQSIYELLGAQVNATIDGQQTTLESPWKSDPGSLQEALPALLDTLSVSDDAEVAGRININEARREILAAIPLIPEDLPDKIVAVRAQRLSSGTGTADRFSTAGWLLIEDLVDQGTMVALDSMITGRGDVYRLQSIGHSDRGGPQTRFEAIIDSTTAVPKIISLRELNRLGTGFTFSELPRFNEQTGGSQPSSLTGR